MRLLLLDSNKTIENHEAIKSKRDAMISRMATTFAFDDKLLADYYNKFRDDYGSTLWEYHPIFWRAFADDCLKRKDEGFVFLIFNEFLDFYEQYVELYDDTLGFLEACRDKYLLALVANGNDLRLSRFIKKFNLSVYFDDLVISGETPFKKPDSFMFDYVITRRSTKVEDTMMIGDRYDTDIIGAKNLGIKTVLIRRDQKEHNKNYTNPRYMPDYSVYSLSEVSKLLQRLEENGASVRNQISRICSNEHPINSALVLAGGKGSRLGKLGQTIQKCMLPINGKPLLFFMISALKNAGCNNVVIVVNHLGNQICDYFGMGEAFGIRIQYVKDNFVSTYDAIYNSLQYLDDNFYYCHGNIVFEERLLESIWKKHCDTGDNVVAVLENAHGVTHSKMQLKNGVVSDISFRPKEVDQTFFNYTFMGVALYNKSSVLEGYDGDMTGMAEKHIGQSLGRGILTQAIRYMGNWWHIETESDYQGVKDKYFWEVNFG